MQEEWKSLKDVIEYGDSYEVSNLGRVRSLDRRDSLGHNIKGKILKISFLRGYCRVGLCKNGKSKTVQVHRLVALAFIPNPNNLPQVNHKDGNKENNCIDNLDWITPKDNIIHAHNNGLMSNIGANHNFAKLTEKDVKEIRELYLSGNYTQVELAKIYVVSHRVIGRIHARQSWKHVV